jgi:DNA-binding response OmpR family regulator
MSNASTILLVDDEDSIQTLLTFPLERDGYRVVQARDGEEALRRFAEEDVDLVVLDVMLPRLDGLEVCKRLRAESHVPIIMLTARGEELDKVLGLELGADDYITKPFSIRDSGAGCALRRAATPRTAREREEVIERGDVRIDLPRRAVEVRGEPVQLTFIEFEMLALLASSPGVVFSRGARASRGVRLPRAEDDRRGMRHLGRKSRDPSNPEPISQPRATPVPTR